jgi:hypothetical protein
MDALRTTVILATRAANMVRVPFPPSTPEMLMNTTSFFPGIDTLVKPFQFSATPYEYKVTPLRECPTPDDLMICDTPAKAAEYWRMHIADHPYFNPECECFVALMLNTRRRVKGHYLVSIGTMDTVLVHPREVFRLALITSAASVVLMHNQRSRSLIPLANHPLALFGCEEWSPTWADRTLAHIHELDLLAQSANETVGNLLTWLLSPDTAVSHTDISNLLALTESLITAEPVGRGFATTPWDQLAASLESWLSLVRERRDLRDRLAPLFKIQTREMAAIFCETWSTEETDRVFKQCHEIEMLISPI